MIKNNEHIDLPTDTYRLLKMLSFEAGDSIQNVINALMQMIHERVEMAYDDKEVPDGMDGYSLLIYKGLHLKALKILTNEYLSQILAEPNNHYLIHEAFNAQTKEEKKWIIKRAFENE